MASGLLSLKWNHHRSTFLHVLANIRQKESYCDVTLACAGKFYSAHKLVLSTCSEYFEEMFERTQCKHPVIVLKDIGADELEALLSYMYDGEVNVLQEHLSSLIKAAECLKIKGLAVADSDPSEHSSKITKDKGSSSNTSNSKDVHRSHNSNSTSNSNNHNSFQSDSSSRQFRNSTGGVKRPSLSSKQDDGPSKRRRPEPSLSAAASPARRQSSERPSSAPRGAEAKEGDDGGSDAGDGGDDGGNSMEGAPSAADEQPPDDGGSDDARSFAQGLSEQTGVKAEPVEIIDSDDMGGFDPQAGDGGSHDASDAEFTEEKFAGGASDANDPSLWGGGANNDMFSQPSTSSFTGQDGSNSNDNNSSGGKGGGGGSSVRPSPLTSPVDALWWLGRHTTNALDSAQHRLNHQHRGGFRSPSPESRHRSLSYDSADPRHSADDGAVGFSTTSSLTSSYMGGGFGGNDSGALRYPRTWETTSPDELMVPRPIRRHSNPPERGRAPSCSGMVIPPVSPSQLECPVCPYKATAPNRLKEHIRKHTGERPFVCPVCQKGFGRKTHLDTHMVIHSGEKPFKCTMCDYRATQKGNLKIHMQSHTGEKPHACRYCNYRAAQKMTLRLHLHNKHPDAVELQQGSSGSVSRLEASGVRMVLFPTTPPPPQT